MGTESKINDGQILLQRLIYPWNWGTSAQKGQIILQDGYFLCVCLILATVFAYSMSAYIYIYLALLHL